MAYHHLLQLVTDAHAGDLLQVLEASQDLVLHLELGLHAETSALLDGEGLLLELLEGAGSAQVDDDVLTALDLEAQGEDDAFARVVGVRDVLALAQAQRGLPLLQRLVVLVWRAAWSAAARRRGELHSVVAPT